MVAAEQSPGLVTAHGSFETFCSSRGVSRDRASRECHRWDPAKLGEQTHVSFRQSDVPDGTVRKRAAVQKFSWRDWLRALRELLTGGRAAGCCVLVPRLSSILEGIPNAKFTKRSVASAKVATAARRDLTVPQTAQSPHTVWKLHPSSCFCPMCRMRPPSADATEAEGSVPDCAQRRCSLGCSFGRGGLLDFPVVGAGTAAGAAGESEIAMGRF